MVSSLHLMVTSANKQLPQTNQPAASRNKEMHAKNYDGKCVNLRIYSTFAHGVLLCWRVQLRFDFAASLHPVRSFLIFLRFSACITCINISFVSALSFCISFSFRLNLTLLIFVFMSRTPFSVCRLMHHIDVLVFSYAFGSREKFWR